MARWTARKIAALRQTQRLDDLLLLPQNAPRFGFPEEEESFWIPFALPYTGITYAILDDGFCSRVCRYFDLFRLQNITQLGYLKPPYPSILGAFASGYSRYTHSFDVMAVATLIGTNLHLSPPLMYTLRLAALTHDVCTPAGGDSVKLVAPQELDEDGHYPTFLSQQPWWEEFRREHGIDTAVLLATIRNEGLLGEVLDIADKIAYISRDMATSDCHLLEEPLAALKKLQQEFAPIGGLWDMVQRNGDGIYFADTRRLVAFLKARVIMFRHLYYHPVARSGEYLLSRLIAPFMIARGHTSIEKLRTGTDHELLMAFASISSSHVFHNLEWYLGETETHCFRTMEEAEAFAETTRTAGGIVLTDDDRRAIKTADHFRVLTRGNIMPFTEAAPEAAAELARLAHIPYGIRVYCVKKAILQGPLFEELREFHLTL